MKIEITKIESSIIDKFVYDIDKQEMIIEFGGGASYLYKNVNEIVVSEFIDAESKGKYINSIKKDYECERIEDIEVTNEKG